MSEWNEETKEMGDKPRIRNRTGRRTRRKSRRRESRRGMIGTMGRNLLNRIYRLIIQENEKHTKIK